MKTIPSDLISALLNSPEHFPVDFDQVWKLIGNRRKEDVKKDLMCKFEAGVDYCEQLQSVAHSEYQIVQLWLSLDCFSFMLTRTENGRRVRRCLLEHKRKLRQKPSPVRVSEHETYYLSNIKFHLLHKLCQEWCEPLVNINFAIHLLRLHNSQPNQYLKILQEECNREMRLLEQVAKLLELTNLDNLRLLYRFNLLECQQPTLDSYEYKWGVKEVPLSIRA